MCAKLHFLVPKMWFDSMFMFRNKRFELEFKLGSTRGYSTEITLATNLSCLSEAIGALKQGREASFYKLTLK